MRIHCQHTKAVQWKVCNQQRPVCWFVCCSWDDELLVTRAPGRLDVMGGIADYSGSLVLQMPIAEACHVALQRQPVGKQKVWKHVQVCNLGVCCREHGIKGPYAADGRAYGSKRPGACCGLGRILRDQRLST
jgi:hypothetical protein